MANIPIYTDKEILNRKVTDVDMSLVFSMPFIERTVFQYAIRDKCLKEIIRFENTQDISINAKVHPKHSMTEARDLLRCFAKNVYMEPVCNQAFNDARECLFRSKMKLRLCKNELDYFEECYHDPLAFAKFQALATVVQRQDKDFHINIFKGDFKN